MGKVFQVEVIKEWLAKSQFRCIFCGREARPQFFVGGTNPT
jgi:hypothetical protein